MQKLDPITPGELLREEFLEPMGISQYRLAKEIGVPASGSVRLWRASARSQRIPICACAGSLACPMDIGCERKRPMIPRSPRMLSQIRWRR